MTQLVLVQRVSATAVLTLNRPEKRNALSRALIAELHEAFRTAEADPEIRAIILTGSGKAFCAGMDLDELRGTLERTEESELIWDDAHNLSALYQTIYSCSKPTIAAVNGVAVAGGAGLSTVCDLALAVPEAKFGYPEVLRGLVAAMVMPHLLRHVGERMARYLLLTGDLITAPEAWTCGLINRIVPAEELMDAAREIAGKLALGGPRALATTKSLLARCSTQAISVQELAQASAEPRLTEECRSGLRAFFDAAPVPWAPHLADHS